MTTPRRTVRVPDDLWERASEAARREGKTVTDVVVAGLTRYADRVLGGLPGGTVEVVKTHRTDGKWSDPPKEALGGVTEVPPMNPKNPVSKPFDKNCAKAQFHFEGKRCRWCGGDHV